jgi:thiol-disulfide isomerase/thioredoxin
LFLNDGVGNFIEASGISGADDPSDARVFAVLDFDRDGWPDLVSTNANAPRTRLFRNQIGDLKAGEQHNFIALRFVGGNKTAAKSEQWGPRDGYGAIAVIDLGDKQLKREFRGGEGLAAQNSTTQIVGIGKRDSAAKLEISWPSGIQQVLTDVPAGMIVTVYENEAEASGDSAFELTPYRPAPAEVSSGSAVASRPESKLRLSPTLLKMMGVESNGESLIVFSTMATWCASCRSKLPAMKELRAALDSKEVAMYGIPVDVNDTPEMLQDYVQKLDPAYSLLTDLPNAQRKRVSQFIITHLGIDALPATVITTGDGQVLEVMSGTPTLSKLRKLAAR